VIDAFYQPTNYLDVDIILKKNGYFCVKYVLKRLKQSTQIAINMVVQKKLKAIRVY